ncbi:MULTISPECIES: hypothetical protein [Brevundimonas]|uniref:hypothetical protein n=1 Tax=Brevundimonas TaxID=41275 RepID=UPI0025C12537|nr:MULTISPECIES: hypothetical protein [Brevundimonas]
MTISNRTPVPDKITFTEFLPAEVAAITGLNVETQRVWRRREQLPGSGTPARFSPLDVAEIFIRYQFSLHGLPPGQSQAIGRAYAPTLLHFALINVDGACEVIGSKDDVDLFVHAFEDGEGPAGQISSATNVTRYLWHAGEAVRETNDLGEITAANGHVSASFVDLVEAGVRLAEAARRPLVTVEFPTVGNDVRRIRRLTGGQT